MSVSSVSSGIQSLYSARSQTASPVPAHDSAHDGDGDDVKAAAAPSQANPVASAAADRGKALNIRA